MTKILLISLFLVHLGATAQASSCRDVYVAARNNIFHNEKDFAKLKEFGQVGAIMGSFAFTGAMGPVDGEAHLALTSGVAVGLATTAVPYAIPVLSKYYDWVTSDMDSVLALLEESRVGVGYHIKKFALTHATTQDKIITAITEIDAANELCGSGLLVTSSGLNSLISEKLKLKSLNTGVLK